jgi:hypothetical protein
MSEMLLAGVAAPVQVVSARYVTIELAALMTGFSPGAIRTKIAKSVWLHRRHWFKPPGGRILIDMHGIGQWQADLEAKKEQATVIAKAVIAGHPPANLASIAKDHAKTAGRRAARQQRTPPWSDPVAIRAFYDEALSKSYMTGIKHHVDHIVPLRGRLVSGLHVAANLQVITASENMSKKNNFEVEE